MLFVKSFIGFCFGLWYDNLEIVSRLRNEFFIGRGMGKIYLDKRVWRNSRDNWVSFESDPKLRVNFDFIENEVRRGILKFLEWRPDSVIDNPSNALAFNAGFAVLFIYYSPFIDRTSKLTCGD